MAKSRTAGNKASARKKLIPRTTGRPTHVPGNEGTKPLQSVYIRLTPLVTPDGGTYKLQVFFDKEGKREMTNDKRLGLLGDGTGEIQFNFIPSVRRGKAVTADLVIIGQTVLDEDPERGHQKATPFVHLPPLAILGAAFYPTYYLPQPKARTGVVRGGKLGVKKLKGDKPSEPYKYTIVALCDDATKVTAIDPCVIIHPR